MGIIGILLAIILLVALAYLGVPVILVTFLSTLLVIVTNGMPIGETLSGVFFAGASSSFERIFLMAILMGILAQFYNVYGGATSIARGLMKISKKLSKNSDSALIAIIAFNLVGLLLGYGGISGTLLVIVMMPIALEIMKEYNIPRYLAAAFVIGAVDTAARSMPGSPQAPNAIPALMLSTPSTSGLIPGLVGGIVVVVLNIVFMNWLIKKARKNGDGFTAVEQRGPGGPGGHGRKGEAPAADMVFPNVWISLIPMIGIFVLYAILGIDITIAVLVGLALCLICFFPQVKSQGWKPFCGMLKKGSVDICGSLMLIFLLTGFGSVIGATTVFRDMSTSLSSLALPNELKAFLILTFIALFSGSGSAAASASVKLMAGTFGSLGLSMASFHRITAFCCMLDKLPHCGAVNLATMFSGTNVKESYKGVFFTSMLAPLCGAGVVALMLMLFPGLA